MSKSRLLSIRKSNVIRFWNAAKRQTKRAAKLRHLNLLMFQTHRFRPKMRADKMAMAPCRPLTACKTKDWRNPPDRSIRLGNRRADQVRFRLKARPRTMQHR